MTKVNSFLLDELCSAVEHGNDEHRAWLRKAFHEWNLGLPVTMPAPRRHRSEVDLETLLETAEVHARFPSQITELYRAFFFGLELCGEAGETANCLKKQWRGDHDDDPHGHAANDDKVRAELTDTVTIALFLAALLRHDVLSAALVNMQNFEQTEKWRRMLERAERAT